MASPCRRTAAFPILLFAVLLAWVAPSASLSAGASLFAVASDLDQGSFSLEEILSSPFPSGLVAAPQAGHVAWVFNDRGRRNLWIASPPEYRGRALTRYDRDDGQEIGSLAFSPDGSRLAFVRGGPPNSRGELPNPASDPAGVVRSVWWLGLDGAEPQEVSSGSAPLFLADGRLLFLDQGKVFATALESGGEKADPEPFLEARGSISELRLSPDGSRLAFTSSRGSHAFVGVLDLASRTLRFLEPSLDRDGSPAWSPDGARIAFLRLPARRAQTIFQPRRSGQPWSIWVADPDTGEARRVFRADEGVGSVYREVVGDQLLWTKGGLVFPWEKEGWTHLYSLPPSALRSAGDGAPRLLTPGDFEVEYVALSGDGERVVFSSNQDDIDRRHLWQVGPSDLRPQALTSGRGVENVPAPIPGRSEVAFLAADGRRPLLPAIRQADGTVRDLAPGVLPESFPLDHLVEPEPVVFPAADGMKIHGQLFRPPASFTGPRPGLLYFHGGSRRHMMLGWHYSSYYHHCYAFHQYMASRGYLVLSVNYRSGIGYGMEFREALDYGATGASELRDVLGAGLYLQSRDDVDGERIGLWGGSYGGYLTALGLARASELFAAGVDIHGVHDWNQTIQNFIPSYEPLEDPERARLAFESSPMASVETWRSPVLLIHGDDDRNVPFEESVDLVEKLREQGVEHEVLVFPDEVHGFLRHESWLRLFERSARFLDRYLAVEEAASREVAAAGGR